MLAWAAAVTLGAGLLTLGSTPFSPPTGSTSPLTVTQTWIHDLDDAPCGVAEASPAEATLDQAGPSVEVGDRAGDLYAFHLSDGSVPAGWSTAPPSATITSGQACGITGNDGATTAAAVGTNGIRVPGNPPIDSTASVVATSAGDDLYFDAGNAADPTEGGYYAYGPGGTLLWNTFATNPSTDPLPDIGVQASPAVGSAGGTPFVVAGSLGQRTDALRAADGTLLGGWPFFSADSVFSTAAVGDLYGTGQDEVVVGGASTAGFAYGQHYQNGGHLRILNDHGGLVCAANTNEEVDSSPAVGPILPGGALGIATGTGTFYPGSDEDTVKVFDTRCNAVWSEHARRRHRREPGTGRRAGERPARRGRGHRPGQRRRFGVGPRRRHRRRHLEGPGDRRGHRLGDDSRPERGRLPRCDRPHHRRPRDSRREDRG